MREGCVSRDRVDLSALLPNVTFLPHATIPHASVPHVHFPLPSPFPKLTLYLPPCYSSIIIHTLTPNYHAWTLTVTVPIVALPAHLYTQLTFLTYTA